MLCRWVCACVRTCVSLSAHCSLFLPCAAGEDKECTGEAGGDLHPPDGESEGGWGSGGSGGGGVSISCVAYPEMCVCRMMPCTK